MSADSDPAAGPKICLSLQCRRCGRTTDLRPGEVFRLITLVWPECCGDIMSIRLNLRWMYGPPEDGTIPELT
jgi:hypothetical protein